MNNYILETEDYIFRPVTMEDAEFIVQLRNLPHTKGFIHNTSTAVELQRKWISDYLERDNEYYWIIEDKNKNRVGTTSFYNYDAEKNQIESGRWIKLPGTGNGSMSGAVLFKDFAFNVLHLSRVVCDTVITNKQVIKYHHFLGEVEIGRRTEEGADDTESYDIVCFEETAERWPENRRKLIKFSGEESDRKVFRIEPDGLLTKIELYSK